MSVVLDASVVASWAFADERSESGSHLLQEITTRGAVAPGHWPLETANMLLMGVRRNRLSMHDRDEFLKHLAALPIRVMPLEPASLPGVLAFADTHRLTAYDAAYVWLAHRLSLPLATKDADVARAAGLAGVPLRPL